MATSWTIAAAARELNMPYRRLYYYTRHGHVVTVADPITGRPRVPQGEIERLRALYAVAS